MLDERRLYVKQLLRYYKQGGLNNVNVYAVDYQINGRDGKQLKLFRHNDGIDFIIDYITDLEERLENLQYVQKIIQTALSEQSNLEM